MRQVSGTRKRIELLKWLTVQKDLKSHSWKLLFVKFTHIYKYQVIFQLAYLDFLRLDCTAPVISFVELEAEAGREDRFRCPFSTLSEATVGSSVREFLRLGVLDFSTISFGSLLCPETMAAFASSSGLAIGPCSAVAGGSFGTKVGEGAEARNKQTGLLLFLTKPESTNQTTKSLLSHYILRR